MLKFQRCLPLFESTATSCPSSSPKKTTPPAVDTVPAHIVPGHGILPTPLSRFRIQRAQIELALLGGDPFAATTGEAVHRLRLFGRAAVVVTALERRHVEQACRRIERRRHPVGRAAYRRADAIAAGLRLGVGDLDGTALGVDALGPGELIDVRSGAQILAGGAVENVVEAVAIGVHKEL